MKSQKIRDLDEVELQHQLRTIEEQLFRLNFQMSMGTMEGLKKARAMKRPYLHHHSGTGIGWSEEVIWPNKPKSR